MKSLVHTYSTFPTQGKARSFCRRLHRKELERETFQVYCNCHGHSTALLAVNHCRFRNTLHPSEQRAESMSLPQKLIGPRSRKNTPNSTRLRSVPTFLIVSVLINVLVTKRTFARLNFLNIAFVVPHSALKHGWYPFS